MKKINYQTSNLKHSSQERKRGLEDTKCLQDCWDMVYEHYNVKITPKTLLDFEKLKKEPADNYRQFYERLLQHSRLHLAPLGAKVENVLNEKADTMSVSLMNHVALQWLRKINPSSLALLERSIQLSSVEVTNLLLLCRESHQMLTRYSPGILTVK